MKTKKLSTTLIAVLCLSLSSLIAKAQTEEVPKFEVGVHFTSITKPSFDNGHTEPGFGGRLTYNLNRSVALEAVGNFFPHSCRFCGGNVFGDNSGNITQGLFGVKAGKRFQKWGIFGKARPGVVSFSEGDSRVGLSDTGDDFFIVQSRRTHFAVDLGGVLEFYPSKRIVTRFEAGDTLIHYGQRQTNFLSFDPTTFAPVLIPLTTRSETRHNFQFSAGVGWRF